ncbi:hypothetical protein K440DRAFT_641529 [Wilcoxina mikolae CBS 423.85]|nr:hypothetical protein K440DRAFT_641529 [Wilcoxina mikolae CBS 423.85]
MAINWQPLRILLALLVAIFSAVASVIILISSDRRPVTDWFGSRARPTVLLAVCTVAANISIHYGLTEGVPVRWWLQAAPNRHTLSSFNKLRDIYDQGNGAWRAIWGILTLKPNRAGIACLACIAVALNGPFLQRASRVETEVYSSDVNIRTNLVPIAPTGFSGLKSGRLSSAQALLPSFAEVVKGFNAREDITLGNETGCVGTCRAEIEGMGFALNCSEGTYEYNMGQMNPDTNSDIIINDEGGIGFWSQISLRVGNSLESIIDVTTRYKNKKDEIGEGVSKNCTLTPATVVYPVNLRNSTVTLSGTIRDDRTVNLSSIQDNYGSSPGPTTMGGFLLAAQLRYNSAARIWFAGAVGYAIQTNGTLGFDFAQMDNGTIGSGMTWGDPMDTILEGMRELMFRAAVAEGRNSNAAVKVSRGQMSSQRQIYRTEYRFLAIGVATVCVGLLGVLPLFWRIWQLKEAATLNPTQVVVASVEGKLDILRNHRAVGDMRTARNIMLPSRYNSMEPSIRPR